MEVRDRILNDLRELVVELLSEENVRVYLFGSWARNEEKQSSDIDIAIESLHHLPSFKFTEISDRVEESTIPYHVDIVNLTTANQSLKENVKKEGILWQDFKND